MDGRGEITLISIGWRLGIGIAKMIAQERRLNMAIKTADLFHKILTHKWVILSVAILLALLAIFTDK